MQRESFKSRLGFLLVSAGCAIGIGNVWKFPFITGQNGGGVFVFFYLLFLVIMGAPVLAMELSVGRASRKSVIQGYKALEPKGSKWHVHGWFCIAGCYLLMMYYTTVSGWMLDYFVKFLTGKFDTVKADVVPNVFTDMLGNTGEMALFMIVTVAAGILVCSIGIQNGVERISKVMMLCLLALIVILAVHSLLLPGAKEGVKFYLLPDFKRAMDNGIGAAITAAMNQSFFTLSIGISSMEIFGSYLSKDYSIGGESLRICVLDTFVAIMSGLIIFPACFSYGIETTAGPSLIFITLPQVFIHMAGGRIWGTLFFLFMTFASLSTVIAVFENLIAACIDNFGWSRGKSSIINLLCPEADPEVGDISRIGRGKHTTRHSELIYLGRDTYLMDTPGFSSLYLEDMEKEDLRYYFPEFEPYENTCRYNGCSHTHEPDCKVKEALEEGKISRLRYDDYVMFYEELSQKKKW